MLLKLLLVLPALAVASPYYTMTQEEFAARMAAKESTVHPASLSHDQARQDLRALEAAVRGVWRQRWDGKVRPVDARAWTERFEKDLGKGRIPFDEFRGLAQRYVDSLEDAHAYIMAAGEELGRISTPSTPVHWSRLNPEIGLLRIDRFPDPDQPFGDKMPELIDKAFAGLRGTRGLILDLRNNAGGDPNQADRLFDHLVSTRVFLYTEVIRKSDAMERYLGPERIEDWEWEKGSEYSKPRAVQYEPKSAERYRGKILILTDGTTVSAGEYVLSELVDNRLARAAGARTPGHSGSIVPAELPNSHLVVALPIQHVLRRNGAPIQGRGILPQYRLDPRGPRVIEEAERILRLWIEQGK